MAMEGGKQRTNKKHNSAVAGTSVKQKQLTTASPQKQIKKSPNKLAVTYCIR